MIILYHLHIGDVFFSLGGFRIFQFSLLQFFTYSLWSCSPHIVNKSNGQWCSHTIHYLGGSMANLSSDHTGQGFQQNWNEGAHIGYHPAKALWLGYLQLLW